MYSNPKQSSDDNSSMEVDKELTAGPSPLPIYKQTLPNLYVSEEDTQYAYKRLALNISHHDTNDEIQRTFGVIFSYVHELLFRDQQCRRCLADHVEYRNNIKRFGEDSFIHLLRDMAEKNSWKDLFQHEVFFKPSYPIETRLHHEDEESVNATIKAWSSDFKGNAATVLLATISDYLDKGKKCDARVSTIVNSSGTGKSRMVDEMSRQIITVPVCLRGYGSGGFPPSDITLRTWLLSAADPSKPEKATQQLHAFVYALLHVTCNYLETIASECGQYTRPFTTVTESFFICRQEELASRFRHRMTSGQSFDSHNAYRVGFSDEVIKMAREFMRDCEDIQSRKSRYGIDREVEEAGKRLCQFIDPLNLLDSIKGPRRPLVIISFDESHNLTDNPSSTVWTLFSELHRVFRWIVDYPIFSLCLSTAARFIRISSERCPDPSTRIANPDLHLLHPICEISFDDVAYPTSDNAIFLRRVVEMDWMCHLGRPLFGTRYDALAKCKQQHLMMFAQRKLLCGESTLRRNNGPGILACLSVRFALEFNPDRVSRVIACRQVELHMRLCLAATSGFKRLVTISSSEPLLAEAARDLLQNTSMDPIDHLVQHSHLGCIDLGRRGELVAIVIVMQARDRAAKEKGWMSVPEFMEALLPSTHHEELRSSTLWLEGGHKSFSETFKDYGMWFNHVVRVDSSEMLSAENLCKFLTRGAMVVCRENQFGVDIVLPACLMDQNLSKDMITAIYIQLKNDKTYKRGNDRGLLNIMNPFLLGLFSEGKQPHPIVRVVLALTSKENGVLFPTRRTREPRYPDEFTAFDVWCAGLSGDTFNHIGENLEPYRVLLDRSLQPFDTFDLNETSFPKMDPATKDERGLRRRKMAALGGV